MGRVGNENGVDSLLVRPGCLDTSFFNSGAEFKLRKFLSSRVSHDNLQLSSEFTLCNIIMSAEYSNLKTDGDEEYSNLKTDEDETASAGLES